MVVTLCGQEERELAGSKSIPTGTVRVDHLVDIAIFTD